MALPTLPTPGISTGWGLSLNNHLEALRATIVAEAPGIIKAYGGTVAPANHAICNGAVVSRSGTYANLFSAIGTSFGAGDGSTTFALPNGKGRTLVGFDAAQPDSFASMGGQGGSKTHTLALTEMPGHNHGGGTSTAGSHSHGGATGSGGSGSTSANSYGGSTYNSVPTVFYDDVTPYGVDPTGGFTHRPMVWTNSYIDAHAHSIPAHTHGISADGSHAHTISSQGGGLAHNNLQPYLVVNYIITL